VEIESQVGKEAHEGTVAAPRRARRLKGLKLSSPRDVALAQVVLPAPPALSRTLPPTGVCVRSTGCSTSVGEEVESLLLLHFRVRVWVVTRMVRGAWA